MGRHIQRTSCTVRQKVISMCYHFILRSLPKEKIMNQSAQPYSDPEATIGHSAPRVEIRERQAWAINGWLGVLAVVACTLAATFIPQSSAKFFTIVPIVVAFVILASLVIVQPGQTRVVRFFGSYAG